MIPAYTRITGLCGGLALIALCFILPWVWNPRTNRRVPFSGAWFDRAKASERQ